MFWMQLPDFLRQGATMSNQERSRPEWQPAQPVRKAETLQGLGSLPVDWTLKTAMRISSHQPIQCCQSAMTAHSNAGEDKKRTGTCRRLPVLQSQE